ncbi:MAG: sugar transferase, partial [Halospina sp.]
MAHVRLFRHYLHVPFLVLGLLDLLVLVLALYLAVFFRYFGDPGMLVAYWTYVLPSALAFGLANLVVMVALAVHQSKLEEGITGMMLRTIMGLIVSLPLSYVLAFLLPDYFWYLGGEGVVTSASVFAFLLLGIVRSLFFRVIGAN